MRNEWRPAFSYSSPRATARTFLIAMNLTEDDPGKIDEATACLDLSSVPAQHRGRYAFELEFILRSINMPTTVIPDEVDHAECTIRESFAALCPGQFLEARGVEGDDLVDRPPRNGFVVPGERFRELLVSL
jgi:hypothetical protein